MAGIRELLGGGAFGLFMLLGRYAAAKWRQSGAARASKEYPELASKLGLTLRAAGAGRTGALSGEYGGYRVFVDPDERPRIAVYFASTPKIFLRTYEHEKRAPADTAPFSTRHDSVDRYFKDRYASPAIAGALRDHGEELAERIRPFSEQWAPRVAHLSITPERLECALDFGRPAHIPREAVEALLPAAVELVRFIESAEKTEANEATEA